MTKTDILNGIADKLDEVLPSITGDLTLGQQDIALNGIIEYFNNLDPDRPVKVKQVTRL